MCALISLFLELGGYSEAFETIKKKKIIKNQEVLSET